jgi:DNA polymerase-3 subunit epsilon
LKPIAVFDLETTGVNPSTCRIVEVGIQIIKNWKLDESVRFLINPGEPIPEHAALIHGIRDDDVIDAPSFTAVARAIKSVLEPCDLAGFNILRFDLPVLKAEFDRTDIDIDLYDRNLIDAMTIFHKREPRNLTAAYKFYCSADLERAHSSDADAKAAAEILLAQIDLYGLAADSAELSALCRDKNSIDRAGKFRWQDDQPCIAFGKHRGTTLRELDRSYIEWMLRGDFAPDTLKVCRNALAGLYPERKED